MKTNHRRGFVARNDNPMLKLDGSFGWEFTNGHRGAARAKAGWKKFLRKRAARRDGVEWRGDLKLESPDA